MRSLISRRNGLWFFLIVSLAFNAGFGTTFGVRTYRQHCCEGGANQGASIPATHERLNLTAEQEAQMHAAKEKLLQQVGALRQELTAERETLVGLLTFPEPDRATIASQLGKIASLQQQLQQRVVEHLLEEKALLTPEQRGTFDDIIRHRVCPWGGRGPESMPGGCELRGGPGLVGSSDCAGKNGR
jgi:Spy/CpxP family protein refolding chaperone